MESSLNSFNETKGMNTKAINLLVILTTIFCVLQIISNVTASRIVSIIGNTVYVPAASLFVVFFGVISDAISNIYGSKVMKKVTFLGIICNIILALSCTLVVALPSPSFSDPSIMNSALTQSIRLVIAGVIALYISQTINAIILQKIKKHQVNKGTDVLNKKGVFIRAYVSSIPAVAIDCIIFVIGAFAGTMLWSQLVIMILCQVIVKLLCELLIQAVISSQVVPKLSEYADYDIIEEATASLNPFKI